ncbi:MAG: UDP-N-acetylmuramoyl-tripeptide--D-alanyl-D-alanine ligase [Deltaproteobacteria bacterium]
MLKVSQILKATGGRLVSGHRDMGVNGVSIDTRTIKKGNLFIAIKGSNFDGHDFIKEAVAKGACCVIREKKKRCVAARRCACIEVRDAQKALGDIAALRRRQFNIPVIAVTGSNGKTTVKDMIAWILSKNFKVLKNKGTRNNQIGLPLTLLELDAGHDMVVLELGTSHSGEIGYLARICGPDIGVITNVGPSHLKYFGSLKNVLNEKYTLIKNLRRSGIAVLNADDDLLRGRITRNAQRQFVLGFGIKNRSDFFASNIKQDRGRLNFLVNMKQGFSLKTLGWQNVYNALAAVAVARVFGLGYGEIASRLSKFNFPSGRLKIIESHKATFIDDTYNSNPNSLRQALQALDKCRSRGRKILVMGDMLELGRRERIFHLLAGKEASAICDVFISVGKLARLSAESANFFNLGVKNIFTCNTSREAREILLKKIAVKKNDVVLVKGSRAMKMEEVLK